MRLGLIDSHAGMTHSTTSVDESIAYIEDVFADYKRYSGIRQFSGRIAEVGPGDNGGVGLLFLADGCSDVDLVDRFYSRRSLAKNADVYRALIARHPELVVRMQFSDDRALDDESFRGMHRRYGSMAAAERFFLQSKGYDFIVSRAVMEHVYDPRSALRTMAAALTPGGMLLHKVDLRDHAMFSSVFHELKFLEVPDWLYPSLTKHVGRPNRVLVHEYRNVLRCASRARNPRYLARWHRRD